MKFKRFGFLIVVLILLAIVGVITIVAFRFNQRQSMTDLGPNDQDITQIEPTSQTENVSISNTPTQTQIPSATPTETMVPTTTSTPLAQPSQTAAEGLPGQAASTAVPTAGDTLISTNVLPLTDTPVPTATPVPTETDIFTPVDWTGNWTAFFGDEGGLLFRATLIVSREGNTITGVHSTQIFTGTLSEDGLSVSGTWVNPPSSGTFSWTIVSDNQFCGNTDGAFAYCGARNGAPRPDPCRCFMPNE